MNALDNMTMHSPMNLSFAVFTEDEGFASSLGTTVTAIAMLVIDLPLNLFASESLNPKDSL